MGWYENKFDRWACLINSVLGYALINTNYLNVGTWQSNRTAGIRVGVD